MHEHLAQQVSRHAASVFRKPVTDYNRDAFEASMAAWNAAGRKPLVLDAGCGVGLSTLHLAQQFPDHFVIGVDQSADRLARNVQWPGDIPANCLRLRADLVDYWRLLLQARISLARHYVLYPNPWPKKQHLGRRWHGHPVFPTIVALGGAFECRSNWRIYVDECAAALTQLTGIAVPVERLDAQSPITPFEEKYRASSHALWRCRAALPTQDQQQ
jgi:tRNA (guanine-N7-)-methyltransferase